MKCASNAVRPGTKVDLARVSTTMKQSSTITLQIIQTIPSVPSAKPGLKERRVDAITSPALAATTSGAGFAARNSRKITSTGGMYLDALGSSSSKDGASASYLDLLYSR